MALTTAVAISLALVPGLNLGVAGVLGAIIKGGIAGATTGAFNAAINGGDIGDIIKGALVGGVTGAMTGALHGVAGKLQILGGAGKGTIRAAWKGATTLAGKAGVAAKALVHSAAHGIVGGVRNLAMGGKFKDGFLSAAVSTAIGHVLSATGAYGAMQMGEVGDGIVSNTIQRTAVAAVIGGTTSVLSGGDFANGAYTAAFQHLFNAEARRLSQAYINKRLATIQQKALNGELSLKDANSWYRLAGGKALTFNVAKMQLNGISASDFSGGIGSMKPHMEKFYSNTYLVHGRMTLALVGQNQVSIVGSSKLGYFQGGYANAAEYDFRMDPIMSKGWKGLPETLIRNTATGLGNIVADGTLSPNNGNAYPIIYSGTATIPR